jgi:hypothetical protein
MCLMDNAERLKMGSLTCSWINRRDTTKIARAFRARLYGFMLLFTMSADSILFPYPSAWSLYGNFLRVEQSAPGRFS